MDIIKGKGNIINMCW